MGPLPLMSLLLTGGARKGRLPVSMVFRTRLSVGAYAAAGREVVLPRPACPGCSELMGWWGWYRRDVRVDGDALTIWVRRVRCSPCGRSHGLLPQFVTWGRLDSVDVIGLAVAAMVAGVGARGVAAAARVGHTTARDWRRRFRDRAALLLARLVAVVVGVSGVAPREDHVAERGVVEVVGVLEVAAQRRWPGRVPPGWQLANVVVGGHLMSTNTGPLSTAG